MSTRVESPVPMNDQRRKALDAALREVERAHGKGAIMKIGGEERLDVPAISTGSLTLDAATGIGGLPRGRIVEVFGPESSGKTTLCLQVVANVQRAGGVALFVDVEHALDIEYARKIGVDVNELLVSQPDTGEEALAIVERMIQSGAVDVVVVDSVAALVPRAEIEGELGDVHVGLQARLMSQALRKLTGIVGRTGACLIFTNQIRERIGVMFGNPETTTGGRALKFYASMRLDIRRTGSVKDGGQIVGNRVRVMVVKNKCAPPFRHAEFDISFGATCGIDREGELIDLAVAANIVEKSGAWFSYGSVRLGQGRENAKTYLREHPDLAAEIEKLVREANPVLARAGTT